MFCHKFHVQRLDAARSHSGIVRGELKERRPLLAAIVDGVSAARREQTSDRTIVAARHHSRQSRETRGAAAVLGNGCEQRFRVRMMRFTEDRRHVIRFDNLARVHHGHALRDFGNRSRDADVAVVYYAGHGIELDGTNYLIPVDATLETDADVLDETLSLDRVLFAIESARWLVSGSVRAAVPALTRR